MRFESEEERMQHPQAKLIPLSMWDAVFGGELSDVQLELMQISQENLPARAEELMNAPNGNNFQILLCCAYRTPPVSNKNLVNIAEKIKSTPHQQLLVAASTGRIDIMNRLMELAPTRVQEMIAAADFGAFRYAAMNRHLDVMNKLIELAPKLVPPVSVQEMIAADRFGAFSSAAKNGHLDVMNKLMELAPRRVQDMIAAANFEAFRNAASNGHLDVMNKLIV